MKIDGKNAKLYDSIRLDSFRTVNEGELIEADETTGNVSYKDVTGTQKQVVLGMNAIKILPRKR